MKQIKKFLWLCGLLGLASLALAQTLTNVPIVAKFTYDDGTPVQATIALYNDATNAVIASQALDGSGKLVVTVQLDLTQAYRVQGTNSITGNPFGQYFKTAPVPASIAQPLLSLITTSEVDIVMAKADDTFNSYKFSPLPQTTISVNLSSCGLSGPAGAKFSGGFWSGTQPGTTWTCQISLPVARTYTAIVTASAWSTNNTLQFQDPAGTTVATMTLQNTNSWSFSTAVQNKVQASLPAGSSTLVIVSTKCCEQMADVVTLQ